MADVLFYRQGKQGVEKGQLPVPDDAYGVLIERDEDGYEKVEVEYDFATGFVSVYVSDATVATVETKNIEALEPPSE